VGPQGAVRWRGARFRPGIQRRGGADSAYQSELHGNTAFFNPSHGEDIIVPKGFKVDVFARDLNQPTGLAFVGTKNNFQVLVIESGKACRGLQQERISWSVRRRS